MLHGESFPFLIPMEEKIGEELGMLSSTALEVAHLPSLKLMLDRRFVIAETMDPSGSLRSAVATARVDLIVIVKVHLEVTRWGGG